MDTVKGTAFFARKAEVCKQHGEAVWEPFMQRIRQARPFFERPLLVTTAIPVEDFVFYHDMVVEQFYGGKESAHAALGAASAQWSLADGPYKQYVKERDPVAFARVLPAMWRSFASFGQLTVEINGNTAKAHCSGLPFWHPCFEFLPMGFYRAGLEIVSGAPVTMSRAPGAERSTTYDYVFDWQPPKL